MHKTGALVAIVLAVTLAAACTSEDCPDERIGQVRCVGNQLERCLEGNELSYENCAARELVCSVDNEACVHPNQLTTSSSTGTSTGSSGGSSGAGGSSTSGAGAAGGS